MSNTMRNAKNDNNNLLIRLDIRHSSYLCSLQIHQNVFGWKSWERSQSSRWVAESTKASQCRVAALKWNFITQINDNLFFCTTQSNTFSFSLLKYKIQRARLFDPQNENETTFFHFKLDLHLRDKESNRRYYLFFYGMLKRICCHFLFPNNSKAKWESLFYSLERRSFENILILENEKFLEGIAMLSN